MLAWAEVSVVLITHATTSRFATRVPVIVTDVVSWLNDPAVELIVVQLAPLFDEYPSVQTPSILPAAHDQFILRVKLEYEAEALCHEEKILCSNVLLTPCK